MEISKPSIVRISRKAGIKSLSEECYPYIRAIISDKIEDIIKKAIIINKEHDTKTLMINDIYRALYLQGENITQSSELGTVTIGKN
jgi:hypothetical protein